MLGNLQVTDSYNIAVTVGWGQKSHGGLSLVVHHKH